VGGVVWQTCKVNLTKRIVTEAGPHYCPAVLSKNGKIKIDVVLVDDVEKVHREGCYYVEWHDGPKRVRLSVGKDAADAQAKQVRKSLVQSDDLQRRPLCLARCLISRRATSVINP
jgi:hypothetical protein